MSAPTNIQVVLLAAGVSKRFRSDKRKARLANGETLWQSSLALYTQSQLSGLVVVRRNEQAKFAKSLPPGFAAIECRDSGRGMWASRAFALSRISSDYVMIALADMPFIQSETVTLLLSALGTGLIIQPSFNAQTGHPKVFHRSLFSKLSDCKTSLEVKTLINENADAVVNVEVNDVGILRDIDCRADIPGTDTA